MAYNGNQNLASTSDVFEFTKEQLKEFTHCARDPIYFIEKYVKIVNIDHGLVNFHMYDFQKDIVNTAVGNRFTICKLPRQVGKTTTVASLLLWYALFNENFSIAILANKQAQAHEILDRITSAFEYLPKWLQQGVVEWNKGRVELANGSKIIASATSSSAIRGTSQNLIYLDEFAFIPSSLQEQFFNSVYPTISSGQTSKVVITSTPNGLNMFYKLWADSEQNKNEYKRVEAHWSDVPGRDEAWKEQTIKNTSAEQFRQEFECEFLGSSNTLIDGAVLRRLVSAAPLKHTGDIRIFHEPYKFDPDSAEEGQPAADGLYIIVVDTSRGVGGDYSAFIVFDVSTIPYKVAAVYHNNFVSPLLYPNFIYQAAKYYNDALVLVETNDIGGQVADALSHDLEYEHLLYTNKSGLNSTTTITPGFGQGSTTGVRTTKTVKRIGCSNFKTLVESDKIALNDERLIEELFRFVQKGQSYEAEEGHDDLVMCCVLFSWLTNQPYFKEITNGDIRQNLYLQNAKAIEESLTPFGLMHDGRDTMETAPILNLDQEHMSFEQWMAC